MNRPTIRYLQECFTYNPTTGKLIWKKRPPYHFKSRGICDHWNSKHAGKIAGNLVKGYLVVIINGRHYRAHRVIWAIYYGYWPDRGQIDHINHNTVDNRIENLRLVSHKENHKNLSKCSNNTSGHTGVSWHKTARKWRACIKVNNKFIHLGLFEDKQKAIAARQAAEEEYDFHPNHGRNI